ncbi:MAG TPA: carboxypeptidase regulatory-like domain-containing protein [Candidatus Sulfotelmatobacter sp.]|nr:carboxypeptidase regulatory-like domain-containing protein [Candidatus Sulfotelmatobacter sp.]
MRTRFRSLAFSLCLLASLTPLLLQAQNLVATGALSGRVTDPDGSVVPGASVVVRNAATGVEKSAETSGSGLFRFNELPPGDYSLTVTQKGFRRARALLQVQVGSTTSQDFQLQVGTMGDTITVRDTTPLLRPTDSSTSSIIGRSFFNELPLNGRKYTDFTLLAPNTSNDGDTGLVSIAGQQGGEDSGYANGNGNTSFTVDGSNATSNYFGDILGRYRIPYLYGENAIQEFQVAVSPYSSIYGGGVGFINTVTRSGTDTIHGETFYYNRNSAFEANDSLSKAGGLPKSYDNLQQFGGGVGGPILRDRLWFFVDYEQQLEDNPISVLNPALTVTPSNEATFLNQNFGLPPGTVLPPPNGPLPVPGNDAAPDPNNPVYLQQVSNVLNALNSNLGVKSRSRDDYQGVGRLDFRPGSRDDLFLSFNVNRFSSPGGVITALTVGDYGTQILANAEVHVFHTSVGWTHTLSSSLLNEFHFGASDDNQISTPTGAAPNTPTIILDKPVAFTIGNAPFSIGRVFERQWSVADRVDWVIGKHTLQFGFDWNRVWDSDNNDGGADPNAAVDLGSFLGSYEFSNLQAFALGQYNIFSQTSGNPTFSFAVPYYGFYVQDTFRVLPRLTLEMGLREDFQVYPQPVENPAFPLTGQYPNQFQRLAPRLGFAWQPLEKTVVRGGFGEFYSNMNGLNYRNAVVSNGLASQQSSASVSFGPGAPNQQTPTFPTILPSNSPLFSASEDISLVSPNFKVPVVFEASLQIEREISQNTTVSVGTMWNRGVHLLSGSAYDLNLNPLQGATTYIVCPPGTTMVPCAGNTITLPNMDNGLLAEGRLNSTYPNLGQINELISPGQNQYNSLFVQLQRRMSKGLMMQVSYTFAKSLMRDGMDFNDQFDFSNTHAPSLLDQRHKISFAAVYRPGLERFTSSRIGRALLSGWQLSSVMQFSSGRPYAGLLASACTNPAVSPLQPAQLTQSAFNNCTGADDSLNDTAFNQDTANTAAGINGAGPTPGIGLNSFYGPWLERIDVGLARTFSINERLQLQLQVQAFNLFNHPNFYVQNGDGVNQIQYNPIGANCGDGLTSNQTCYLVPNSGPGNFGSLQEISPYGLPRALQFSARFTF